MKTATNAMQQASVARTNLGRIWKFRHIYVFLLPAIVWYAIFCYYPMYGVLLAFKDYKFNLGILGSPWVGLKYFETFLTDSYFYIILKNTLAISLLKLICGFPAPILFALMINEVTHVKYKKVVQTLSYLPHFVSWVVVISLMQKLFSPYNGIVNDIRQMIKSTLLTPSSIAFSTAAILPRISPATLRIEAISLSLPLPVMIYFSLLYTRNPPYP